VRAARAPLRAKTVDVSTFRGEGDGPDVVALSRVTQQDRNLSFTGLFAQMRFLIHDRESKFSAAFDGVERERARKRALSLPTSNR
jgi:hypothetical protein